MRVLLAHNAYQLAGGEDVVFEAEAQLLEDRGHEVLRYTVDNDAIADMPSWAGAAKTFWNRRTYREVAALCREGKPDVAHFHNTFPLMSPAGYYAARRCGVPVVQTLHNYRLMCPNALFLRDGRVCEDCLGHTFAWPGVRHACYRGSRAASAVTAAMSAFHRLRRTWNAQVDVFISPTEFAKGKFIAGGVPGEKIHVKPHFLSADPGEGAGDGGYALFVGRLAPEKGLDVLLEAWKAVGGRVALKVVGAGPEEPKAREMAKGLDGVELLGHLERDRVFELMKSATVFIFPSLFYESFGLTIIEALATGLPVIASNHGAAADLIVDGVTGLLFRPGDAEDLAEKVLNVIQSPELPAGMRSRCREAYLTRFTPEVNHQMLMRIYEAARASHTL